MKSQVGNRIKTPQNVTLDMAMYAYRFCNCILVKDGGEFYWITKEN